MSTPRIPIPRDAITAFCQRWKISEFALFGSVLRDDFGPDSDVDVLVSFSPEVRYGLFDMVHMEDELREIFGRDVDLLTRRGVEGMPNPYRRQAILDSLSHVALAS
jgi:predicted nucleotidyltransferase